MKFVGLFKLAPVVAMLAVGLSSCADNKFAKQTHGGSASANNQFVITKPKIDVVVFQDDSDSIIYNGPLDTLRPQMVSFLSNMSDQWDYRFTVMPLLTSNIYIQNKYVVASDCSTVTNSLRCLSPSEAYTFSYSSGDYGWINTSNFSGGDDRGFQNMRTNLSSRMSGFLRSDAALAIIVLSNGDDLEGVSRQDRGDGFYELNYNTSAANSSFSSHLSYFTGLKSSALLRRFYPVVVSSGSCLNGYRGKRYIDMANAFGSGSRSYNICNGELGASLNDIKQQLVSITQAVEFNYAVISPDRAPVPSSIVVWKNGAQIPQSATNGWTYVGYKANQATSYAPTSGNIRSGYMIQLNGTARYKGSDQITFDFSPQ